MATANGDASGSEPQVSMAEIAALAREFPGPDLEAATRVLERDRLLAKPKRGLGQLEGLTEWLASWQSRHPPRVERPSVAIFAGSHGVAARDVSSRGLGATAKKVAAYGAGKGAINAVAGPLDADFQVFELALEQPTQDFTEGPAMTDAECARAMAYGMMSVGQDIDVLVLGQVGVGGDVSAAALLAAIHGGAGADWVDPGHERAAGKAAVVDAGVALHKADAKDAFDLLRRLGGQEIAAMAGAILAARMGRTPIVLDGMVAGAAAAVVGAQAAGGADHCAIGHVEDHPAGARLQQALGKTPILSLGLKVGEGVGAALAVHILRAAAQCHSDMATRQELQRLQG